MVSSEAVVSLQSYAPLLFIRGTLYDVEYDNKTSFYFDHDKGTCRKMIFPVVSGGVYLFVRH